MRPVVRGHHDQLHRPSGARHSRPHPAARAALVGIAVRRHRLLVQPRLRLRIPRRRARAGPRRGATRLRRRGRGLEHRGDRSRLRPHRRRIFRCPRAARIRLLSYRQTWAFAVGKLLADPIWWFYLYWLPKFLDAQYGIRLAQLAAPLIVVYLVADVGSVGGGWLSSALIKHGWTVNRARKTALLAMALLIAPRLEPATVAEPVRV